MGFIETAACQHTALHSFPMDLLLEAAVPRDGEVGNISYNPLSCIRWDYHLTSAAQLSIESSHLSGWGVQRGGRSVCMEDLVVAYVVAVSSLGLMPDFLLEQEAKPLIAEFCRPKEFRWRVAQVSKFSDFLQEIELPFMDYAAATTNESYRCKSKMWFRESSSILVQCKASDLNSAHVTSLTDAKRNYVCEMNRGPATWMEQANL